MAASAVTNDTLHLKKENEQLKQQAAKLRQQIERAQKYSNSKQETLNAKIKQIEYEKDEAVRILTKKYNDYKEFI